MTISRRFGSKGLSIRSSPPIPVASFTPTASSGEQSSTAGRSGRKPLSQRRKCIGSLSLNGTLRTGTSNTRTSKATSACTRSIASQPFETASRCQAWDASRGPSRRNAAGSRLRTSKRTDLLVFSVKGIHLFPRGGPGILRTSDSGGASNRFDFVSFYAHCQGSLDCIHGNHQRAISVALHQHALDTIQRPAADPHPLAELQERMRRPGKLPIDQTADRIDLLVRNGDAFASRADQPEHPIHSQNPQALRAVRRKLRKHVTAKQGQFHGFLAITPATHLSDQRQKRRDASFLQPLGDDLLMA